MPLRGSASDLVRLVMGQSGRVRMRMELILRFDYGSIVPWVRRDADGSLEAVAGPDRVSLRTAVPLRGENLHTVAEFEVAAGETVDFTMSYTASHLPPPSPLEVPAALADTESFWTGWSTTCREAGEWTEAVRRSLITLKALTYAPTGGMVAAPTTSLPEQLGGSRNWDYRYCWVRDATLTLMALINFGYHDEAHDWRGWLLRASPAAPRRSRSCTGSRASGASPSGRCRGYLATRAPPRCGSAMPRTASSSSTSMARPSTRRIRPAAPGWRRSPRAGPAAGLARASGDELARAGRGHLGGPWTAPTLPHSKVMAWVAFDRAVKDAEEFMLDGPVVRWRALRDEIDAEVCRHGFDPGLGSFVQAYGSRQLDASLLLLPVVGFLPPEDPRILGTIAAVESRLLRDGLVLRYDTAEVSDGLPAGEGASFPAASGSPTPSPDRPDGGGPRPLRAPSRLAQRCRPAERGV